MNNDILYGATSVQDYTDTVPFLHIDSQSDDDMIALYRIVYAYSFVIYPEGGGKYRFRGYVEKRNPPYFLTF